MSEQRIKEIVMQHCNLVDKRCDALLATPDQVHLAIRTALSDPILTAAIRSAAFEDAAKVCDDIVDSVKGNVAEAVAQHCADTIRVMRCRFNLRSII